MDAKPFDLRPQSDRTLTVEEAHEGTEPLLRAIRIECAADDEVDRCGDGYVRTGRKSHDLAEKDVLDVARAEPRLHECRGVDVELQCRLARFAHVRLETGRDLDDEHEPVLVHRRVDLARLDLLRLLEVWRIERGREAARQRRAVLVDYGDGRVVDGLAHADRLLVDGEGEGPDDDRHQEQIAEDGAQLLDPEPEYVLQPAHRHFSCLARKATAASRNTGVNSDSARRSVARSASSRPLVNAPTLRCVK